MILFKNTFLNSILASLLSFSLILSVNAADKALIIGVGQYADARYNLQGIDLDIINFQRTVKRLGVKEQNIKVLKNSEATVKNIQGEMRGWLSDVGRNDKVFFYFSGHGSQKDDHNNDETDGLDEFLAVHEFSLDGDGALTDDELGQLLTGIPSDNVYVFIDACHSGTATKGLNLTRGSIALGNRSLGETRGIAKFIPYSGMARAKTSATRGIGIRANSGDNYVAITATQDDELAIATAKGSIFTLGIGDAITQAIAKNETITPNTLVRDTTAYIHKHTDPSTRYTPALTGNANLFDKPIQIVSTASEGEYWQRLSQAASNNLNLTARSDKPSYKVNDEIKFYVNIPEKGYLNVITVDEQDNATVVFPNQFVPDNKVDKGELALDNSATLGFEFYAMEPLGKSLTLFIVTKKPLDLYGKTVEGRDENGNVIALVASLSANAMKAISVRENQRGVWTTQVITSVTN